jgi:cytochrome c553
MKRAFAILAAAVLVVGVFAVSGSAAGDVAKGKTTYTRACLKCHAADGSGNAAIAKALKVELKPLGGADVQKKTDDELKKDITEGTGKMQKVAGLSADDVTNVIAYVRSLAKK